MQREEKFIGFKRCEQRSKVTQLVHSDEFVTNNLMIGAL